MELVKSFNGKTEDEIKDIPLKVFIEWDELGPSISRAVRLRSDETLEGIIIRDNPVLDGIHVCISRRRGRKEKENEQCLPIEYPKINIMDHD